MIIQEITMSEFEEGLKKTQTVIIPIGTTEEHGPHLPLATDIMHVYEMIKEAARRVPMFIAPPINYGICRSTSGHTGTITISSHTLKSIIKDIVISLYEHRIRNFMIISGHAGGTHMSSLFEIGEVLLDELSESKIAVVSLFHLISKESQEVVETEADGHAGELETSLIMYVKPHLVKDLPEGFFPQMPQYFLTRDKKQYWPTGVWGDPKKASAEKGKQIFDIAVEKIVHLKQEFEKFEG
ncbi:MAG: creatininase family protein [Thermodesulfobacteriota bacterium]|nr:creatininase family protein [Thermodesulfobacteriota bacterium]